MAIANLHETLLAYTLRKKQITVDLAHYQGQKALAAAKTADANSILAAEKADIRDYFKYMYNNDCELQEAYIDYTEIPDFEDAIDKVVAEITDELDAIAAWETQIDNQITTESAELLDINAYMESFKTMLSANIQEDFNHGLNS